MYSILNCEDDVFVSVAASHCATLTPPLVHFLSLHDQIISKQEFLADEGTFEVECRYHDTDSLF